MVRGGVFGVCGKCGLLSIWEGRGGEGKEWSPLSAGGKIWEGFEGREGRGTQERGLELEGVSKFTVFEVGGFSKEDADWIRRC